VLNNRSLLEYNMSEKQEQNIEEKKEIARKSLEYIGEDQTLFLDAGTTVNELAKLIVNKHKLNVVTNSLLVANTLAGAENIRLIICPGVFREKSMAVMGQLTDQFVNMFSIDIMFLGVEGVNLNDGITVPDIADGTTKHNVQIRAKKTICLADSTKFKKSYFFRICDVTDVNTIITGKGLSNKIAEEYKEAGINLIRV
jgi:DeoR family fructose operon transcriptional repressor